MSLIEALSQLPLHQRDQFGVLLAGDLPPRDVHDKIAQLGLSDHVRFTGLVKDTRAVLGCSDVSFVLSRMETLSYACREAMSAGLPVIASACGGLPENVDHNENGWIVPVGNASAIARVLQEIIEDPSRFRQMGEAARRKSVDAFCMERFLAETYAVYLNATRPRTNSVRAWLHWLLARRVDERSIIE